MQNCGCENILWFLTDKKDLKNQKKLLTDAKKYENFALNGN